MQKGRARSARASGAVSAIDDRRLAASLRLLVAASRELAASFDYAQTLAAVGGLVVPGFAIGFSVEVEEGEIPTTLARTGRVGSGATAYPLIARGRRLGVLRIAGAAPLSEAARGLEVWDELALRVAVAIDAAQVYAREHHVADTLQRALLPERLPVDDRLVFDAAYLPGAQEAIVGGDWYDAFRLPYGRIAFGIVDPQDATITYASAGHPAPVLALPGGSVQLLPKDGVPLGIVDRIDATDWTFTLPPGATFALYTDGLIEYSRDVVEGERKLLEAVREGIGRTESEPARALLRRVFAANENTDDVAMLTIATADVQDAAFGFTFTALPMAVPLVRRSLDRFAQGLGLDAERRFSLLTATGEAIANAVEHAYALAPGLVRVQATLNDDLLLITIEDEGKWKPAARRDDRGRGLPLMRALMDAVEIRTHQARTEVRLTMALSESALSA